MAKWHVGETSLLKPVVLNLHWRTSVVGWYIMLCIVDKEEIISFKLSTHVLYIRLLKPSRWNGIREVNQSGVESVTYQKLTECLNAESTGEAALKLYFFVLFSFDFMRTELYNVQSRYFRTKFFSMSRVAVHSITQKSSLSLTLLKSFSPLSFSKSFCSSSDRAYNIQIPISRHNPPWRIDRGVSVHTYICSILRQLISSQSITILSCENGKWH